MTSNSKTGFASFSLPSVLLAAIEQAGFKHPTDIQHEAIPAVLAGKDVLARADTGSGKTAAFVLPLLANLSSQNPLTQDDATQRFNPAERARDNSVQILVLVPTRELAIQVAGVFEQFAKDIKPRISCMSVYGGVKINPQMMALRGGADVLVTTPGRLLDLAEQNAVRFNRLKALVVDEVDRLMKGDFEDEIKRIARLLPNSRQNLMFSATFPDSLRPIVRHIMRDPAIINLDEALQEPAIDQHVVTVNREKKNDLLAYLLNENDWRQVLIFCSAKRTCDNLVIKLAKRGISAVAMHGNKEQSERMAAMRDFKSGAIRILIATDVAARGIDVEYLPCVINFDLPRSPNDYIHRIGRTARAGQSGQAITLLSHDEYQHFRVIEKRNGFALEREQVEGFEADEVAPVMPKRNGTRKKLRAKNKAPSAKKKQRGQRGDASKSGAKRTGPDAATPFKWPERKPQK